MPYTSFDLTLPVGRINCYLYRATEQPNEHDLWAVFCDEYSQRPNYVSNPPEDVDPIVVNRIPITLRCSFHADPAADLTDPQVWAYGNLTAKRLGTFHEATDNQKATVLRVLREALSILFKSHDHLELLVMADTQGVNRQRAEDTLAKAQQAVAEASEALTLAAHIHEQMKLAMDPDPMDVANEVWQDETNKLFGVGIYDPRRQ